MYLHDSYRMLAMFHHPDRVLVDHANIMYLWLKQDNVQTIIVFECTVNKHTVEVGRLHTPKHQYRDSSDMRGMWQGLQSITDLQKKTSHVVDIDVLRTIQCH